MQGQQQQEQEQPQHVQFADVEKQESLEDVRNHRASVNVINIRQHVLR